MKNDFSPLSKIKQLTTSLGIYQHGRLNSPDPKFGYALEDQARALIVAHEFRDRGLEKIYLKFIIRAKKPNGLLYHYYYEDGRGFEEDRFSSMATSRQEAYGTTLWALIVTNNYKNEQTEGIVGTLKEQARLWTSLRAIAAALIGLTHLPAQTLLENELIQKLHSSFRQTATNEWVWFENYLVYANAILPWAIWEVGIKRKDTFSLEVAEKSTRFLLNTCQINSIPAPIGNREWFKRDGKKATYDQQPIDAAYMVCCLEKAFLATKNNLYFEWAKKWWQWFWGNNLQRVALVENNWACFDALTHEGPNLNQGAEANICFLMAYLAAKRLKLI